MSQVVEPANSLVAVREVVTGPLSEIAQRFSRAINGRCPHTALTIYTRECTGRPRKIAGAREIIERVTLAELDDLKREIEPGAQFAGEVTLARRARRVWAVRDISDTLLVLVVENGVEPAIAAEVSAMFGLVATSIRQQVTQASPDYLVESRAASVERARTIAELTAIHEVTLLSILSALRSSRFDDGHARTVAAQTASAALVGLRTTGDTHRALAEEDVTSAFARLRDDMGTLLSDRDIEVIYVNPPLHGRPLPGEIAHAARAAVRTIVLALAAQPALTRLRIAWDCGEGNLLIDVRDQQATALDSAALSPQLAGRVKALQGTFAIEGLTGWGNRVTVTLPLDPSETRPSENPVAALNRRELEVLGHLSAGKRNKIIADELGISENTVKFHVARLLKKLGAATRGEAVAIGLRAGPRESAAR
ncbi:LuxR C-terminal-related transcriptional regulator [Nocardia sp. NPDC059239]|uniref:LuxR C-terminal-related transcriptional regulator n=1 Tax=Nocardia sp. NPDC059239 TaxID=3346785 RepID=UPI00368B20AB